MYTTHVIPQWCYHRSATVSYHILLGHRMMFVTNAPTHRSTRRPFPTLDVRPNSPQFCNKYPLTFLIGTSRFIMSDLAPIAFGCSNRKRLLRYSVCDECSARDHRVTCASCVDTGDIGSRLGVKSQQLGSRLVSRA